MKLRTSFFNKTVLKKDITRFAPVWGLYTVFMLMTLFLIWADENEPARFATNASYIMMAMGIVNFVYAGLCSILLFGDLFSSKMCNALHAMPMRREGWFLTHFTAGLLFCIGPNCLGAVLACMILQEYCYLAFLWLAIMVCQFLFFFGAGAFSVQCAGNRLGGIAVYGLFNFLAVLAAFLTYTFYTPVLYGIKPDWESFCRHSPVVNFTMSEYVAVEYNNMTGGADFVGFLPENWRYLFIALFIGVALLGAAVLLYRKRQMESAGDFIAVKPAAPVFLVLYTLCVGAVLYFIADQLGTDAEYLFLLIGFAIGFFTGWMLLEKKVNIFKPKRFLGFGVLTLAFFLTIAVTWMDPLGITRYVPRIEQVQSVTVCPHSADFYLENRGLVLTEQADMENILALHSDLIQERTEGELCLQLRYKLKDGRTVDRKYFLEANSENGARLKRYISDFRYVTQHESVDALLNSFYSADFYTHCTELPYMDICTAAEHMEWGNEGKFDDEWLYINSTEDGVLPGLLAAIEADCKAGNMAQHWEFHTDEESLGNLTIYYHTNRNNRYDTEAIDITVYASCENTVSYLKSLATK